MVNLRWATQSLQNSNRDKVSRKKNAQGLPEELVEHFRPATNLPKYIQYTEEVYDKRNNTTREFILVAEHPTLKRLGNIKFASSKSRDVSITQKYDQANAILQFINSNPNVTESELRRQVSLIKGGSEFETPIDFSDGQDKRARKSDPDGVIIHRPTLDFKSRRPEFNGYNGSVAYDTSVSKCQNYMKLLNYLAKKYQTKDANFIAYLNTLPKFDADDEATSEPTFVAIIPPPVVEPIAPQQIAPQSITPLLADQQIEQIAPQSITPLLADQQIEPIAPQSITPLLADQQIEPTLVVSQPTPSNLFVLPQYFKMIKSDTRLNAEKTINK